MSARICTSKWRARRDELFQKDGRIAERGARFVLGLLEAAVEVGGLTHDAHAASTSAHGGFHDERKTDFAGRLAGLGGRAYGKLCPRQNGNAGRGGEPAGRGLITEQFEQLRRGTNKSNAGVLASAGQCGILGEKTISGMDGVDALLAGQSNNARDVQISFDRTFTGADQVGFVGFEAMQAEAVLQGINANGAEVEFIGGAENANRDFTAVGSQQPLDGPKAQLTLAAISFCTLFHERGYCTWKSAGRGSIRQNRPGKEPMPWRHGSRWKS